MQPCRAHHENPVLPRWPALFYRAILDSLLSHASLCPVCGHPFTGRGGHQFIPVPKTPTTTSATDVGRAPGADGEGRPQGWRPRLVTRRPRRLCAESRARLRCARTPHRTSGATPPLLRSTRDAGPFCHRALLALEAKSIPYQTRYLDTRNKPAWCEARSRKGT